jgi:predicted O-linked N-acetylglucosamine transferase (SPINDLY family)
MVSHFDTAKQLFMEGAKALESGDLDVAEIKLSESLQLVPDRESTKNNLSILYTMRAEFFENFGEFDRALSFYDKAIELNQQYPIAWSNKGAMLAEHYGLIEQAITCLKTAIQIMPTYSDAHVNLGVAYEKSKNYEEAISSYDMALSLDPNLFEAWNNRGNILNRTKKYVEALESFDRALTCRPDLVEIWNSRGSILSILGRYEEALTNFERAIALKPDYAEPFNNRGNVLNEMKCYKDALASYDNAIKLKPDYFEAWSNRGVALKELRLYDQALESFDKAIAMKSDYAEAWNNRGNALFELRRHEEALKSYDNAIKSKSSYAEALSNRGNALSELRCFEDALDSYDRSIAARPDCAEVWRNHANACAALKRYSDALSSYMHAFELQPELDFLLGELIHIKMRTCNWKDLDTYRQSLLEKINIRHKVITPFVSLSACQSPISQKYITEVFTEKRHNEILSHPIHNKIQEKEKVRIGYFSADFYNHAVSYLVAELIEAHDRKRFEIYGFSFGPNTGDSMRKRLESAFDKFFDIRHLSDLEITRTSRRLNIDIAVDLGGHTKDSRPLVFAERAAPIQINYLGYPGTTGITNMDYLIADRILIPTTDKNAYSEQIIYLPYSYQANDSKRSASGEKFSREELSLPAEGFIFCCFNNNWKITPELFSCWMRILNAVKKSVLWLFEDNPTVVVNLRKEASSRNIDSHRIVFAKRMPHEEHLARYRLADLFLDTLPYNAHTTASDALWIGLPVLTCQGETFAGRVASSLLTNIGLPELITRSLQEYESLAIELATNPDKLAQIKTKLAENRLTTPLFDTPLFTKHIEAAYQTAYDRYQSGLPPDHIYVEK